MITDLDRPQVGTVELPEWLPRSVAHRARKLPAIELAWPAVQRLIADPRMRSVWHELSKQRRIDGAYLHPAQGSYQGNAHDRQSAAMAGLFQSAGKCAKRIETAPRLIIPLIETSNEIKGHRDRQVP
jgi:hypothetical protein